MAAAAPILALAAGALAWLGVAGANLGLLTPMSGFGAFVAGALLGGLLTVIVSLVGILLSRGGRDPRGRTRALVGLAVGQGLLLLVLVTAAPSGDLPPINDITTDLENPPAFASASDVPDYQGRDMSYPPEFAEDVRRAYPDLQPIQVASPPPETFARSLAVADTLGWEIVYRNPTNGSFDARDETPLFRFVDDVTVRIVLGEGGTSRVDMRSKSRDGRGDLGANAVRIRAFRDALRRDGSAKL